MVRRGATRKPLQIEFNFDTRTIRYQRAEDRKPPLERPHHNLIGVRVLHLPFGVAAWAHRAPLAMGMTQVLRSNVNEKKVKLMWQGRDKPERILLSSREHRQRFYEGEQPCFSFPSRSSQFLSILGSSSKNHSGMGDTRQGKTSEMLCPFVR